MPLLQGGVLCEEELHSADLLFLPYLLIHAEACADPLAEFPDGLMVLLPERSYPSVYGRPSLIRNPSLPHPLMQGGIEDMGIEL